jgi:PAS domain S-box-containing protein
MTTATAPSFLAGGGELGARLREFDWSRNPLGPPEHWPQSLKTAVRIMLTSSQPIWIGWGEQLIYLYNDPYKSIIGAKHPWALGQPTREVWREIREEIEPLLDTAMQGDEGIYVEEQLLIMERNGYPEETYYTFSYSPIPDDNGRAGGIICANTDDTARVIGERQITLLKELAARTGDARSITDACQRSAEAIATGARDFPFAAIYLRGEDGYHLAATAGIAPGHPAAPEHMPAEGSTLWPLERAHATEQPQLCETLPFEDGSLPSGNWDRPIGKAAVFPIYSSGEEGASGALVVGLNPVRLFDEGYRGFVTLVAGYIGTALANGEAYEEERRRAEALAEIDRAKTAFFANVSHEFRTPLTLMLGPLEDALAKGPDMPHEQRERLEVAHRNTLRLLKLVNALLDFSRIEANRAQAVFRPTDLGALTEELASSFRAATDRVGLQLRVGTAALTRPVNVDRDMWEKILLNLLSNAFKFTFEGEIAVTLEEADGKARLQVRDTGIGIPEAELPKLFERFHRVEGARGRSFEGSGIGLALVSELVKQHGGEIRVDSTEGRGTTFTIDIPFGEPAAAAPEAGEGEDLTAGLRARLFLEEALRWLPDGDASAQADEILHDLPATGAEGARTALPHKVLLADDNADLRDYVSRLLRERGYRVRTAHDGEAALAALREDVPDLLLTDVMMPRMDGFELLRQVRADAALRDLSVIMLSARSGEEARVEGLDAGADDYLIKPFSARELLARVESLLIMARQRREALAALRESEERFRNMADHSPLMMWVTEADGYCTYLNRSWYEFTGQQEEEALGFGWLEAVHPDDRGWSEDTFRQANERQESFRLEYRLRYRDGSYRWAIDAASPRFAPDGTFLGYIGSVLDIDERRRQETLRIVQSRLLELAIRDMPLAQILERLIETVEAYANSEMLGSVLLLDDEGHRLRHGAAPSLPEAYNTAIDGMEIGPDAGSCGSAAYRREPVFVADIATDPLWKDYRELALQHGLGACYSTPIFSARGRVLGTFAIYFRQAHQTTDADLELVDFIAHTAALLIERKRAQDALQDETRLLETLNRTGAALAGELDLERVVQLVTDAGVDLTGAKFGALFYNVTDEGGESFMLYTLSGVERSAFEHFPMPRNTALFDHTFSGRGIVRVADVLKDERYGKSDPHYGMPKGHLPVRSYLAVPVISRSGEVIGGLFFGHPEVGRFSARHERLMEGLAGQAAVAIDNARLYQDAQREMEQRRAAEAALQQLNEQLESRVVEEIEVRREAEAALHQAQRMESIGQLTGGIAHDFNNLLQVISGNLQLLAGNVTGNDRAERRIQNALTGVNSGAKLASQLLAFGRRQALEPKVVSIGRLVRGLDDMLRRSLGEEIEIRTRAAPDLWNTLADPSQVENALLNLAINARDAMDGRGRLTIEVENAVLDEEYARAHPDVTAGEYVVLAVSDTGVGMAPEIVEKVFEPFFTTKPEGRGTGLGLSMVYGFAKQSGGHVKIYSEVGQGTTIRLYLPRVIRSEDELVEIDKMAVTGGSETVLVVEDDAGVRATAADMLGELGYSVHTAPDADAALVMIENGLKADLLFTDVVMPGTLRSPELARSAQAALPDLAVLFTSGYAQDAIVHGGRVDEGVNLLAKPYTREALARKVRHVLDNRGTGRAPRPAGRALRVLLVEDDLIIRMSTADMLADLGHRVLQAGEARQALELMVQNEVDVLVTDVKLPGMSGLELAEQVRRKHPGIGIVLATGDSLPQDSALARHCVLLAKPYGSTCLKASLRRWTHPDS